MLALVGVALVAAIAALGYVAERHRGVSTSWATLEEFDVNRDWMSKPEPQLVVIAGTVVRVHVRVWRRNCSVQLVLLQFSCSVCLFVLARLPRDECVCIV